MKSVVPLKINKAHITYTYFNKNFKIKTKNLFLKKNLQTEILNLQKKLFLKKSEQDIKKIKKYELIVENNKIIKHKEKDFFVTATINIVIEYENSLYKTKKVVKKFFFLKKLNNNYKFKNLRVSYLVKNLELANRKEILADLTIKCYFS